VDSTRVHVVFLFWVLVGTGHPRYPAGDEGGGKKISTGHEEVVEAPEFFFAVCFF
jgi:hypothetical protein